MPKRRENKSQPRDALARKYGITDKQAAFVREYMVDCNAMASARRAGYSTTSHSAASQLMSRPKVRAAINAEMELRSEMYSAEESRVIQELCQIAFADVGEVVVWNNERAVAKYSEQLPKSLRRVVKRVTSKDGKTTVELHDKMRALELLGKHLGMFVERQQVEMKTSAQVHVYLPEKDDTTQIPVEPESKGEEE